MVNIETLVLLAVFLPLVAAPVIALLDKWPNLREASTLITAGATFLVVLELLGHVLAGARPQVDLVEALPGVMISFEVEPLGMLFACVASGLWIVNSLYSIGYMRGGNEKNQTRFYICFTFAISSAIGIAFAGNLFTLFLFYEIMTITTYPLVVHKQNEAARRGGRIYLGILISTSILFQLTAILWTYNLTGTVDFTAGGILSGKVEGWIVPVLLGLFMFGIGKAALMPFHHWLPNAMVAPTPVSALLHAVAVVKAGVFSVMKVAVYIFGIDFLASTGATEWLMWVAAFTLLSASVVAMTKDNLKARLAYSTVSQLAYVVLGVSLANSMGVMGGSMQIIMHAFGKITLFFCAGAIYVATQKTEITQMNGLGRKMPFTFGAFLIGAIAIIGLPPMGGSWVKWYLIVGAADAGQYLMILVLMISSLLNIAYLMPVPIRGFFMEEPKWNGKEAAVSGDTDRCKWGEIKEAPLLCVIPLCFTALGCIVLFFTADRIFELLAPIAATGV